MHRNKALLYMLAVSALIALPNAGRADPVPGFQCPDSTAALCNVSCTPYQLGPSVWGFSKIETSGMHIYQCSVQAGVPCNIFYAVCGVTKYFPDLGSCQADVLQIPGLGGAYPQCPTSVSTWGCPNNTCNPTWPK